MIKRGSTKGRRGVLSVREPEDLPIPVEGGKNPERREYFRISTHE